MKEVIGYVYKELKDNFVNTVCSEPTFELDKNDRVVVVSYKTEECYKILGKPLTEIKNNFKTLADNARILADKLDRLADLIEETASDSVYNTCIEVKYTFEEMAEELEKLSE